MIAFRSALPRDRRFCVLSWLSSYRKSVYAGMICDDDWADVMFKQIERVLDRPNTQTYVAYSPDAEPGVADLHGFIATDSSRIKPIVYFCYTKQPYRRSGIARSLFRAAGIDPKLPFDYTCHTVFCDEPAISKQIPFATFTPALARQTDKKGNR